MSQTQTNGGEQKVLTDAEFIREIAKGYQTDMIVPFKEVQNRLQSIADDLESLEAYTGKTPTQIVESANALARHFYQMHGNIQPKGFKFYEATHPMEVGMWNMAVAAFDYIVGTDVLNALAELRDEQGNG